MFLQSWIFEKLLEICFFLADFCTGNVTFSLTLLKRCVSIGIVRCLHKVFFRSSGRLEYDQSKDNQ